MPVNFEQGLVAAIVQEQKTGDVLMVGYMNREAYQKTMDTGSVTFYSRSRKKLWTKGEFSGHRLLLREARVDCDGDALLVLVDLEGPGTCHEGYRSCFFRRVTPAGEEIIAPRVFEPERVYGRGAGKEVQS